MRLRRSPAARKGLPQFDERKLVSLRIGNLRLLPHAPEVFRLPVWRGHRARAPRDPPRQLRLCRLVKRTAPSGGKKQMSTESRLADRSNMAIVYRAVADLKPYEKNARTHSAEQIGMIMENMKQFGWTNPLLIDEDDGIIAGHGRLECARRLHLKSDIPCIVLTGLTAAQKQALVIADNSLAAKAGWDTEILASEISEILENGFDLAQIGFNEQDLALLLGGTAPGEGLTDPDDVPTPPMHPVSVLGDVWLLGAKATCPKCGKATTPRPGAHTR